MWQSILEALSQVTLSRGARDDDFVDQLHHFVTVALLGAFAALIGMKQYVGDPIHCWVPAQFTDSHKAYTENLCWISHMYYVPMDETIPFSKKERMERDISFYRWVVVVLLLQCLLFRFPNMLWKELRGYSGINVQKIVNMADDAAMMPPNKRDRKIQEIAHFVNRWLDTYRVYKYNIFIRVQEKVSGVICFVFGKRHGTYLTGLYFFIKILYLVNVICQFVLLTVFLNFSYYTYGFEILAHLNDHGEFMDYDHFPRVVMCDIEIRQMQNIQTFSTQCVLSVNLFVEKIFSIIWFWFFLLTVASVINVGQWFTDIFLNHRRERFIQKYLIMLGLVDKSKDSKLFKKFVAMYLRDDGVFVLRSIGNNSSDIVLLDLVQALWEIFKKRQIQYAEAKSSMVEGRNMVK